MGSCVQGPHTKTKYEGHKSFAESMNYPPKFMKPNNVQKISYEQTNTNEQEKDLQYGERRQESQDTTTKFVETVSKRDTSQNTPLQEGHSV